MAVEDLGGVPESDRYDEAIRRVTQESRRAFDLIRDSLFRARLLRLADDEHILVITKHHITSDWWSWGVLYRELTELYRAFSAGKPSPLPPLPVQYADVAAWQRASLRDETLAAELHYWRGALEGGPTTLELPTDRPRPPAQTFRGERKVLVLPTQLSKELRALSRREGVTLFATLLAAFQILLFRLTGQEDLVVGTPTTNRSQIETEGLIGLFVNTVVVRGLLDGSRTFRSFLKDVRNAALAAFDHKDVPFNQVVRALGLKSDPSRNPLFQVMFALGPAMPRAELVGVEVVPLQVHAGGSQVDLTLFMEDLDDGISGIIEYNTDLFDADTISRFGGHFLTLLTGIVENPGAAISALPVLNESERRQLLVDWNATDRELPASACVHQLFERQCARTPEAVAVCFEETRLTYSELDRRAN